MEQAPSPLLTSLHGTGTYTLHSTKGEINTTLATNPFIYKGDLVAMYMLVQY